MTGDSRGASGGGLDRLPDLDAAALAAADPMVVMRRVVDQALAVIPNADGAVVEIAAGNALTYVCAAGALSDTVGTRVDPDASLSGLAMRTGDIQMSANTRADPRVDSQLCARLAVESMICLPLTRGGARIGVLKVSASRPRAFRPGDVAVLARLADFIGDAVGSWADLVRSATAALTGQPDHGAATPPTTGPATTGAAPRSAVPGAAAGAATTATTATTGAISVPVLHARAAAGAGMDIDRVKEAELVRSFVANVLRPGAVADRYARRRVRDVLDHGRLSTHIQPIIDLKTRRIAGFEALTRFPDAPSRSAEQWFADAARAGLSADLQLAALSVALDHLPLLPRGSYLAVNVGHDLATVSDLHRLIGSVDATRVVIELTEHLQVQDYPALIRAVDRLREAGARLAIDDTGAGFAGFSHILKLRPDLIKLDRILTTGIDTDPARQALAGALVNFATATRASVVAEGIETAAELDVVHQLGIGYGQGYHLGRPAPVPDALRAHTHPRPTPADANSNTLSAPDSNGSWLVRRHPTQ